MERTRFYQKRTLVLFVLLCTVIWPVQANHYWKDANVYFDGFSTGIIRDIEYAEDGLWLGAENGLFRLAGEEAERFELPYLTSGYISDLELTVEGDIWLTVYGTGIFLKRRDGAIEKLEQGEAFQSAWQVHDTGSTLLVLTVGSVLIYDKRSSEIVRKIDGLTKRKFDGFPYIFSNKEHTLIIEGSDVLHAQDSSFKFDEYEIEKYWPRLSTVSHIAHHRNVYHVVGPEGVYSGSKLFEPEIYRSADRPLKNIKLVTSIDDTVTLVGNSLSKLTKTKVEAVRWVRNLWDDQEIGTITSATESEDGDIYIASSQKGLIYIPTFFDAITTSEQNSGLLTRALGRIVDGNSISSTKIYRKQIDEVCDIGVEKPFCQKQHLLVSAYGENDWLTVAVNNSQSNIHIYNSEWQRTDQLDVDFEIQDITISESGAIYALSETSEIYVQMSRTSWRKLPIDLANTLKFDCFFFSGKKEIYLCSKTRGLFLLDLDSGTISTEELSSSHRVKYIRSGTSDAAGTLWIATNSGLFFKNIKGDWMVLNQSDGVKDIDFEYKGLVAAKYAIFTDGDIYNYRVNSSAFANRIDSRQRRASSAVIRVIDKKSGKVIESAENNVYDLVQGDREVMLYAFINNYILRHDLKLEYLLSGEGDWVSSESTYINHDLSTLSPGTHTIALRVSDPRSYAKQLETLVTLHILPPWWRTWQAMIGYIIALMALSYLGYRNYLHRVSEQGEMLSKLVDEKHTALENSGEFLNHVLGQRQRIMANLSHEIRTPLALVVGPISQIMKSPADAEVPELLDTANRNAQRIQVLVDQMLELEKLDYMRSRPKQLYDLDHDIPKITYDLKPFAAAKEQTLSVKCSTGKSILLYEDSLEKILSNLVSNAVKYTHVGGNITVKISERSMQLLIEVSDNGQGIPDDMKGKIFERYAQLDKSKDGVGVGLALVKELVNVNDGHIKLKSSLDEGTSVSIWLPLINTEYQQSEENSVVAANEPERPDYDVMLTPPLEDKLILIVDDNDELRHYLHKQVRSHYHCLVAGSGRQALEIASRMRPDLIVTDYKMPGMDGLELIVKVREQFDELRIPVIVMSAFGDPKSIRDALSAGADSYLTKPVESELLLLRIRNVLERQQIQIVEVSTENSDDEAPNLPDFVNEKDQNFYFKFIDNLASHYTEESFNRAAMASEMAVSERQLSRKLRAIFDKTFNELLKEFRLEQAKQMLAEGMQVTQVGLEVGFSSPSQFSRVFRDVLDMTPTQYQQENAKPVRRKG